MTGTEKALKRAQRDAKTRGIYLCPDPELLQSLLEGLTENEKRYGYPSCPCRVASGTFQVDRDIICPCDYRDPDVQEHGCCYCALYVDEDVHSGEKEFGSIPERRPEEKQLLSLGLGSEEAEPEAPKPGMQLYYCKVCGYVAFREEPPYVCPICQAKREMFAPVNP